LVLTGHDLKATNTFSAPQQVMPQGLEAPKLGSKMAMQVPPRSYTLLNLSLV
jgi:alpha-L-arabinofuranosidase